MNNVIPKQLQQDVLNDLSQLAYVYRKLIQGTLAKQGTEPNVLIKSEKFHV